MFSENKSNAEVRLWINKIAEWPPNTVSAKLWLKIISKCLDSEKFYSTTKLVLSQTHYYYQILHVFWLVRLGPVPSSFVPGLTPLDSKREGRWQRWTHAPSNWKDAHILTSPAFPLLDRQKKQVGTFSCGGCLLQRVFWCNRTCPICKWGDFIPKMHLMSWNHLALPTWTFSASSCHLWMMRKD